jgi:hypothetical protein
MQASSIEAREKFLGAWSNVSRLEVLTAKALIDSSDSNRVSVVNSISPPAIVRRKAEAPRYSLME